MAIPILLFAVALAVRAISAVLFLGPAYPDSYYYVNVAQQLATGGGFNVDFIWNFVEVGGSLPDVGVLPIPSNAHWMPLAAIVQVPFVWALGPTPLASALPFWIAAAAVAPLTYLIGRDAGMPKWQAGAAGLLVAMPAAVSPFLGQPDNFALFMLLGPLALWLCARGIAGSRWAFAVGGVVVGLAFLSRNDGVLLGVPFALAFLYDVLRTPRGSRIGWSAAIACLAGFVLMAAPWLLRQVDVFGSLSPSSAGGRILFISEYRELFSVTGETTLESFLAQGVHAILQSRLDGLASALMIFGVLALVVILAPFLLVGAWVRRGNLHYLPWFIYVVALLMFSAIISAVHVPSGTFLHSAVALIPHAYLLVLVGVAVVVHWVAARRQSWDADKATRNFSFMLVGVVALTAALGTSSTTVSWRSERDARADVLATLANEAEPGDRVMSPDAGAYRYQGGWSGIVTPDDPLAVVEEALRRYGVRWLALERAHATAALRPVLGGQAQPDWLSAPLVVVPPEVDDAAHDGDATALPRAALFAVCLQPGDDRCDR